MMDAVVDSNANDQAGATKPTRTITYDFVIVGSGCAGQSAFKTLKDKCPSARIAVIDPVRLATGKEGRNVDQYKDTATGFNPKLKTVQLMDDTSTQLKYKYGILLATGSRGAPPPLELFQLSALPRVFELRTTELPRNSMRRPVLAPEHVRRAILGSASKGAKVAILGSGWDALDLACVISKQGRKKPAMVFGSQGPAWNILPQYLSSELRKRLVKKGVDIQDRSIVRYIADIDYLNTKKIEMHTAKSYDLLDTRRTVLDMVVLAPDSFGNKGTAALPTRQIPEKMVESGDGRPWYKTWAQLAKTDDLEPSMIACFEGDGRVVVNSELCAASKVYAAGSVSKYPNSATGSSAIAGEGILDGTKAGRVAATNMSKEYSRDFGYGPRDDDINSFAAVSLPVWRSDLTSYQGTGSVTLSSLGSLGIRALCVGNCDSEKLGTRSFWWTNASAYRKLNRALEDDSDVGYDDVSTSEVAAQQLKARRRLSRRHRKLSVVNGKKGPGAPLFGTGVVFYLNKNGRIRGIMTWGLPFTAERSSEINSVLLKRLKVILASNAGVSSLDAEENHQEMNTALARASQDLVSIAFKDQPTDIAQKTHGLNGPISGFSTPLYRYTEILPATSSNLSVLKRKEGGALGVLGEDMFALDVMRLEEQETVKEENGAPPSNIPVTVYPVTVVPFQVEAAYGSEAASLSSLKELNQYLAVQRGWEENEERARPGKEDLLWLRPGDERKNSSKKQMIIEAYRSIMYAHRE
ncbi:MAG: hypothetical protein SGBAC_008531 [Bacillariaceae sp.]